MGPVGPRGGGGAEGAEGPGGNAGPGGGVDAAGVGYGERVCDFLPKSFAIRCLMCLEVNCSL